MSKTSIFIIRKYKWSIFWTVAILLICLLPKSSFPEIKMQLKYLDKIGHLGFYFLQIFLILFESKSTLSKSLTIKALAYCILLGITVEFGQKYFLLGRSFDIWDIVANIIGSIIGIIFFRILKPLL